MMKLFRHNATGIVVAMMLQAAVLSATSLSFAHRAQVPEEVPTLVEEQGAGSGQSGELKHGADSPGAKIASWMVSKGVSPDLVVVIIAALPIVELRGAIPVAHHVFGMGLWRSFGLSVLGNMLPVPAILLLLGPVSDVMRRVSIFDRFFTWLFSRTRKRTDSIRKYQELGLILFIAVPLPATGAWTGALAAFLFGLRFWLSMFCVVAGVAIAGVIVSVFSYFGWAGAVAAGVILSVLAAVSVLGRTKKPAERADSPG